MALDNLDHKLHLCIVLAIPYVDADKNMVSFNLLYVVPLTSTFSYQEA